MKWLIHQVGSPWPRWFDAIWAKGAIALGTLFVLIALIVGIRHFVFDQAIVDGNTDQPMSRNYLIVWLFGFGGGGAFFAIVGCSVLLK